MITASGILAALNFFIYLTDLFDMSKQILIMKNLCLIILAISLLSFQPVIAQPDHGRILLSVTSTVGLGSFGTDLMNIGLTAQSVKYYGGGSGTTYSKLGINVLPRVGYFVADNLAIGADVVVNFVTRKSKDSNYKFTESTLAAGPFARYYFRLEKVYPFIEGSASFGIYRQKWSNDSNGDNREGLLIYGGGAGIAIPVGKQVMIDAMAGYSSQTWKNADNDRWIYGTIGLKIGISLFFGPTK